MTSVATTNQQMIEELGRLTESKSLDWDAGQSEDSYTTDLNRGSFWVGPRSRSIQELAVAVWGQKDAEVRVFDSSGDLLEVIGPHDVDGGQTSLNKLHQQVRHFALGVPEKLSGLLDELRKIPNAS